MTARRRVVALGVLAVAAVVALVVITRSTAGGGTLRATFQSAVDVVPGEEVRVAGRKVGEVGSIKESDGDAVVSLKVGAAAWPLHRGTTARLRYGSVGGYAARFVTLEPGPRAEPELRDGGILTSANTISPVEYDQIFNMYDAPTRRDLRGLITNAADTVDGRGDDLARGLHQGSYGLERLAGFMGDLGESPAALHTLVRSGARTAAALRSREGALRGLIANASSTFDELAGHARAQQQALERFPAALRTGRHTLGRLDRSLVGLRELVGDLGPGARGLRAIAPSIRRTTEATYAVAPLATSTLRAGTRSAPDIDRMLRAGTSFNPRLGADLEQLSPMLACLRPYSPEIAGWASTWLAAAGYDDEQGGNGRTNLTQLPPTLWPGTKLNSKQITDAHKDAIFYAMPRPPGLNAGHPWFLPQCGAGPDSIDPSKDPETR